MIEMTRRGVLTAGAALLARPTFAAPKLAVPEVDSLAIRFLVDGAVHTFAEPQRSLDLIVERAPRAAREVERRLLAEFGLSLLIESRAGGELRTVLLDFGYSQGVLVNNAGLLGVDPGQIDAMVLSHGHHDHFGGLQGLLSSGRLRRGTPLLVGGEEALCHRLRGSVDDPFDFGMLDQPAVRAAGVDLRIAPEPAAAGHGLTTGAIPLTIERPRTPTWMEPGKGCARERLDPDKRDADRVEDDSRHELGLVYNVKGRGLVVFGSCSHRGILNTIVRAHAVTGVDRLHAVIGGFHLVAPQTREDAVRTAERMTAMGPDYVVPGHCSGEWFIEAAQTAMPGKVIRPYVGSRFIFGTAARG